MTVWTISHDVPQIGARYAGATTGVPDDRPQRFESWDEARDGMVEELEILAERSAIQSIPIGTPATDALLNLADEVAFAEGPIWNGAAAGYTFRISPR
jgi:hypothetical protein